MQDPWKAYQAAARIVHSYVPPGSLFVVGIINISICLFSIVVIGVVLIVVLVDIVTVAAIASSSLSSSSPTGGASAKPLASVELENAKSSLCSATLGVWETKSGALSDSFKAWWYLQQQQKQQQRQGEEATAAQTKEETMPSTAEVYRRSFMRKVEVVTDDQVLAAMAKYVAPLFDQNKCCVSVASPLAEHLGVAKQFGMKGPGACVFCPGGEAEANRVVSVAEKDLNALFPLVLSGGGGVDGNDNGKNGGGDGSGGSGGNQGAAEEAEEARWPVGKQPLWRTHRTALAGGAAVLVGLAGLGVVLAIKAARAKRH